MIRILNVFIPTSVLVFIFLEPLLTFGCYTLAVYLLFPAEAEIFLFDDHGLLRIAIVTAMTVLGAYFNDLYAELHVKSIFLLFQKLCLTTGAVFIAQALLGYINRSLIMQRWMMFVGSSLTIAVLFGFRLLFRATMASNIGQQRLLFIGWSPTALELTAHLQHHPELGLVPIGFVADGIQTPEEAVSKLGGIRDLLTTVDTARPDRLVVRIDDDQPVPTNELLDLRFSRGLRVEELATFYETTLGRVCIRELRPLHLIFSGELGPNRRTLQLQSVYMKVLGLIALVIAAPIMAIVAVLVKITSPGVVLYRQKRVGLNNRPFILYKFRSMTQHAEAGTGAVWAKQNDPRITPLGYWLRKLRLDELPQLINVVRGEMSLVGPRPERPEFVKFFNDQIPYYRQRHCVLPGITGWAQINYKYGDTIEDSITKLEYDLYYVKNISLSLDLYIMFHTVKTMLLFRGAQ